MAAMTATATDTRDVISGISRPMKIAGAANPSPHSSRSGTRVDEERSKHDPDEPRQRRLRDRREEVDVLAWRLGRLRQCEIVTA